MNLPQLADNLTDHLTDHPIIPLFTIYSGFEVTSPDLDLKPALDHAAHDK